MKKRTTQFETLLEKWAVHNKVDNLIDNNSVFVIVDKYNKPVVGRLVPESKISELSITEKNLLEELKKQLPSETMYFKVFYDEKNKLFLIRKKTPIQSMLNCWAIVIILWALYRWYFKTTLPVEFDEFIAKPLVFILPVFYYVTQVEKKNFFSGLWLDKKLKSKTIFLGVAIGLVFFVTGFMSFYLKHKSFSVSQLFFNSQTPLLLTVLIAFATSISEEILTRGFVLKRLYEDSKNIYTSTLFTSILFFFMHVPILFTNEHLVGSLLFQVIFTDFMFSLAVSFLYLETKSLYLPILIHALYNISIYMFSS